MLYRDGISFSIIEHLIKFNTKKNLCRTSNSYMIKITSTFIKYFNFIFAFNMNKKSKVSRRYSWIKMQEKNSNEKIFRPRGIFHLYIAFILHILHSYIVYLHLDQVLFVNFSSGKS